MLSSKLIQLIEDHWEQITAAAIQQIRADPDLPHMRELMVSELRGWHSVILRALRSWNSAQKDGELAEQYEELGRRRFEEGVPLHETIRSLHILKHRMVDFVRNQGFGRTSLELYAEEELEHRIGLFFDCLIYYVVRGYENAVRSAAPAAFQPSPKSAAAQINWDIPYL